MQSLADADGLTAYCRAQAEARYAEERKRLATRHEEDMKRAKENHVRAIDIGETRRDERIRQINEIYAQRMVDIQTTQASEMSEAVESHRRRMSEIQAQSERNLVKLDEHYKSLKEQVRTRYETKWAALATRWREGMQRVGSELSAVQRSVDEIGPTWDDPSWPDRPLPRLVPPVIRMGTVAVKLAALSAGSLVRPPADGRHRSRVRASRPAAVSCRGQPADRDPHRGPIRGAWRCSRPRCFAS